jgi:hypothetical protein
VVLGLFALQHNIPGQDLRSPDAALGCLTLQIADHPLKIGDRLEVLLLQPGVVSSLLSVDRRPSPHPHGPDLAAQQPPDVHYRDYQPLHLRPDPPLMGANRCHDEVSLRRPINEART